MPKLHSVILCLLCCQTAVAQDFVDFALGGRSLCAIDAPGNLECTVSPGYVSIPTVDDGELYSAVSAGSSHTCAITQSGEMRCWGINFVRQLDIPSVDVGFVSLSASGNHTCAIDANTQVHCWGQNYAGQIDVPEPNTGFVSIHTGDGSSCGMKDTGELVCWTNDIQITGTLPDNPNYTDLVLGQGGIAIQSCGLTQEGSIDCWASNEFSVAVPNDGPYQEIKSNRRWLCGLGTDGVLDCNFRSVPGFPSNESNLALLEEVASLPLLSRFEIFTVEDVFTSLCGLTLDGSVVCLGDTLPVETVPGASDVSLQEIPVAENLSFSAYSDTTVELFWEIDGAFKAGGSNIYRDGELLIYTVNGGSFIDDTLDPDQEYVYTVALVARTGIEGPLSTPILVSTGDRTSTVDPEPTASLTHPGQPTNITKTRYNDSSLELFWDRDTSNPRYLIYRNGEFLAIAPGPTYFDDDVNPDTAYYYTIVVQQRSGNEVVGVGFVNEPAVADSP